MLCIPINHRETDGGKTLTFNSFRLVADKATEKALGCDLKLLTINDGAAAVLKLTINPSLFETDEGYTLTADTSGVIIAASSVSGLHCGLATLRLQMACGGIAEGKIYDEPRLESRGIMLDVSRGKMPSIEYLKSLISLMSDLKYNILQLYCEDKLALSKHPSVGKLTGAYTKEQITELDNYCKARFIELQPCIQTYSHMHGVLRLAEYCHMAENSVLFSFAAGNEAVYKFLEDEFSETLPWFSSKTLNINMDEAYDIGTGYTKAEVEKHGAGEVFVKHIERVVQTARKCGAEKIIMWGDIAGKYPQLLNRLPENVIVCDWNYNPQESYPSLKPFKESGIKFWAAGGVSTWNSLFPRVYNSYTNLIGYSAEAAEHGADGFLVTDWGDYGHFQPLGLSLYGYIIGAQQAFWAKRISADEIEKNAFPLMLHSEKLKTAFKHLMDSNLAPNIQTGFKTMSVYYFFDDMLNGLSMNGNEKYPKISPEAFTKMLEHGEKAYILLREAENEAPYQNKSCLGEHWEELFGNAFLQELLLSARMTVFTAEKGLLAYKIKDDLQKPELKAEELLDLINKIKSLYTEFLSIRRSFEKVWLLRAYETGIEGCLTIFDKAGTQLAETVKWLAAQQKLLADGGKADANLQTYRAADGYGVLWTSDFKNMWDRAYPWQ